MNKKFAYLLGLLGLASTASAATAVVFTDEEGVKADKTPAYSFTFEYGDGASIDTTNVNGAVHIDFVAPAIKDESAGAGYGFGWLQTCTTAGSCTDKAMSLSTYKGVCLAYTAEHPFRVDFKQSNIKDDNYYGAEVAAAATPKKTFIAFADLKRGWNSATNVAWNASSYQMGMQFSYKNTHAVSAKSETNAVVLHSLTLADECATNAPKVTEGFSGYNGGSLELVEGKIHTMDMKEVFEDADGDDLVITVKIVSETKSIVLVDSAAYNQNSIIKFTTAPNPQGDAVITLTATDPTKKTATFKFTMTTKDVENLPVAKNSTFKVNEDETLKVGLSNRLTQYGSDADGDDIKLVLVSGTSHGTLDFDEENGIFEYVPDANYNGFDTLAYKFVEVGDETRESEVALGIIEVVNVNDDVEVEVLAEAFTDEAGDEHAFKDTLVVDEDFEAFKLYIPKSSFIISDVDGDDDYKVLAKASGVFNAELTADDDNYIIEVSAKKDSNGTGRLNLVVSDPKVSIPTVIAYVVVNPVADPVTPVADSYDVYQDSLNTFDAKKGVMANDINPDKDTNAIAVLDVDAEHGTVVLKKDGSFTYEPEEGFLGEDYFGYKIENADGTKSKLVVVTLNVLYRNKAPKIVEGVEDTVSTRLSALKEDFSSTPYYKKAEMQTWFVDDSTAATALKFSVRTEDSLLSPTINSTGTLQIKAVKDACGDAAIIVTATDKQGASTDLVLYATIECVNDKPVPQHDTIYIPVSGWEGIEYDLNKLAKDVDGDELIFNAAATTTNKEYFNIEQDGSTLNLSLVEDAVLEEGNTFTFTVKIADSTMAEAETPTTVSARLVVIVGQDPSDAIKPVFAGAVQNWQGAIKANRGMAAIFDMQGRVMWKSALPVSESEVRAAAASVQGRKVLRVNHQVYTIK